MLDVVDGDTVRVGGQTIRLHGIDAPETDQRCLRPDGQRWACGVWAAGQVAARWAGRPATCDPVDTDRYGRIVAVCRVGGVDIGAELVAEGVAFAYRRYSRAYVGLERRAAARGFGLHGSEVVRPEDHRRAQRPAPQAAPASDCAIKGNISSNGRIYHLPGQEHYARTRISPGKGERWFCSEAQARAAGWRRAHR